MNADLQYLSKAVCIVPCIKKLVTNVVANSRVVMVDERSGDDVEEEGDVQY